MGSERTPTLQTKLPAVGTTIFTVMSALARARQRLQRALTLASPQEASREL